MNDAQYAYQTITFRVLDCISVNMFSTALVWKVGSTDSSLKILVKRTMLYAQYVGRDSNQF